MQMSKVQDTAMLQDVACIMDECACEQGLHYVWQNRKRGNLFPHLFIPISQSVSNPG